MPNLKIYIPTKVLQPEREFTYQVQVGNGQSTTPLVRFATGYPAAFWNWGDGSALEAVTSNVGASHTYTNAGTYTVKLVMQNQQIWLTYVDLSEDKVKSFKHPLHWFPALGTFIAYSNSDTWVQDISNWRLPAALTWLHIGTNASVTGDISNMPPNTAQTGFLVHQTGVSGSVAGWTIPATCTLFYIGESSMTGCPVMSSMVEIQAIYALGLALNQTTVDLYLSRAVAREAQTTYANPVLNLGGNNAAPSAAGVTDKNTLAAAGWTVTVNP